MKIFLLIYYFALSNCKGFGVTRLPSKMTSKHECNVKEDGVEVEADLRYVSEPASDASDRVGNPTPYPRSLYPEVEPFDNGHFETLDGAHSIYYEQCGNPNGIPAIFLHGGPGAGVRIIFLCCHFIITHVFYFSNRNCVQTQYL